MWFSTRCSNRILSAKEKSTIYENNKLDYVCIKSRVVTGLLTGHNTVRRHLYLLGLTDSPLCRGCGMKEETLAHILCECEAWPHSDIHIWVPFFWNQRILRVWAWGPSGALVGLQGSHDFDMGHKGPINKGLGALEPWGPIHTYNQSVNHVCSIYRMSQEEWTKLRESVPYVELYRYNPKHLYPKLNGYGDNCRWKVWASGVSTYCTPSVTPYSSSAHARQRDTAS